MCSLGILATNARAVKNAASKYSGYFVLPIILELYLNELCAFCFLLMCFC